MPVFESRCEVAATAAEAFDWHARPGAFVRLAPPWERIEVLASRGGIGNGARLELRVGTPPLAVRWVSVHRGFEAGRRFVDEQEWGPFAAWVHEHEFTDLGPGRSAVLDRIHYALPFGAAGRIVAGGLIARRIDRAFRHRRWVTANDLARHAPHVQAPPLRVAITGASGLIGGQLAAFLTAGGHEVHRFVRERTAGEGEIGWNPAIGRIDHEALEGLDVVVHLAGASIAGGRWTEERKREIVESRAAGTKLLAEALAVLRTPPRVFLSASAVGYYGHGGEATLDESARAGSGFLAEVARAWEGATEAAESAGIRTVKMRFGVILTSRGGALPQIRRPFLMGAGGPIGSGRQGFSWIALDDAIYAIQHLIHHDAVRGPVNVVAGAVSQSDFAKAYGSALHRPAVIPLPARAVTALFGRMGEEVLLQGQYVEPAVLRRSGFSWSAPRLADALAG